MSSAWRTIRHLPGRTCSAVLKFEYYRSSSPVSPTRAYPSAEAILDARGQPLFKLKKKILAIHSTYVGTAPNADEPIFTVKSSFSIGTKLTATFRNVAGDGRETELVLRGNILDRSAEITTSQGVPVARISRQFANAGQVLCE
jgi:uncharacterized protein YxjI